MATSTDWELWTATTTRKTPKRLRFVERDTSDPPPIVVGTGTERAIPYAVETEITLLGENGSAIFRTHAPSEVQAITSGSGPRGWRVAALLASGDVVVLNDAGSVAATFSFAPGEVKWIGLAPRGLIVQLPGARVEIRGGATTRTVQFERTRSWSTTPKAGSCTGWDRPSGSVRWEREATRRFFRARAKQPIVAALDTHGLAWRQGSTVNWACAVCLEG